MNCKRSDYPVFASRSECENHPLVRQAIRGGPGRKFDKMLQKRIPILALEVQEAEMLDFEVLHELGDDLFGSPNAVMDLRSIAKAGSGKFWIPIDACTSEWKDRAARAYTTDKDYSYAFNQARTVGAPPTLTVEQFIHGVANAERGGNWTFYCVEVRTRFDHYWKMGIAEGPKAALARLNRRRICEEFRDPLAEVKLHGLITQLASKPVAKSLEVAVESTFGDLCRRSRKQPAMRFGKEQFCDDPRIRKTAGLLRNLGDPPASYLQYFE